MGSDHNIGEHNMTKRDTKTSTDLASELSKYGSKSDQIRFLRTKLENNSYRNISKVMTKYHGHLVRPQHVRGVLITPVKKEFQVK